MAWELNSLPIMAYLFRRKGRLSFAIPDIFLPLCSGNHEDVTQLDADFSFSEGMPYFEEHDGEDIEFRLQEETD